MKSYKDIVGDGGSDLAGQVGEHAARVESRMAAVKHVIAVMSGKGGVGKSSVAVHLASAFALQGRAVGIVDADINGPSIAKMTGVRGQKMQRGTTGMLPAVGALGIKVMSMDLFLPEDDAPVIWDAPTQSNTFTWRGMVESAAVREFLSDTEWGALDYLLVDLPPGTDKLPHLVDLLPQLSGAVIVTIPAGVSQFVVGKSIKMANDILKTPVLGLIENMSSYLCRHCGKEEALFPNGNGEKLAADCGIAFLGKIPFDACVAEAADSGVLFPQRHRDAIVTERIFHIAKQIEKKLR